MPSFPKAVATGAVVMVALGITACGSSSQSADTEPIGTATAPVTASAPVTTQVPTTTTGTETLPAATATQAATGTDPSTITTVSVTTPDSGGAGLGTGTATTATATGSACRAADLTPAAVTPNSAPGTTVLGFTLTNASSATCHTTGWPGIQLLSATGQSEPTDSIRTTSDVLGATPQQELNVAPGQQVSFRLTFNNSNGTAGNTGCDDVAAVAIIAPDDTVALKATIPGGQVVDDCGTVRISALQPGASGTGQ